MTVTFRAQSGTGKTATFSISILQKVDIQLRETQALVLSPTRELAVQIQKVLKTNEAIMLKKSNSFIAVFHTLSQVVLAIGDYMSVQCHACIGGTNVGEDIRKLDYGQHVVSGTPGRVFGKLKSADYRGNFIYKTFGYHKFISFSLIECLLGAFLV